MFKMVTPVVPISFCAATDGQQSRFFALYRRPFSVEADLADKLAEIAF